LSAGPVWAIKAAQASTVGETDGCIVFVQNVMNPIAARTVQKLEVQSGDEGAKPKPKLSKETLEPDPDRGDRFVEITVILSATEEIRSSVDREAWKERRPRDLTDRAVLVFNDGSTIAPAFGMGLVFGEIEWDPDNLKRNKKGEIVMDSRAIWEIGKELDPFLGRQTLYFEVFKEQWKVEKPRALRIGDNELEFQIKRWEKKKR
jgi:hypothetical protein